MPSRTHAVRALWIIVVAVAYYGAAQAGLRLAIVGQQVTPFWPPTGIALASLLLLGVRIWPGIALGAFVTNLLLGPSLLAVAAIAAGNTAGPLGAYLLLSRAGFRNRFDRFRDALALVFLGALAGMLISATIGSAVRAVVGQSGNFWTTWSVWWTGDAMGVLMFTPLILVARTMRPPRRLEPLRVIEAVALGAGTSTAVAVFAISLPPLLFLVFPFLTWAAVRYRLAGALPCALIASVVATVAASHDLPTFAGLDLPMKMIYLQAFNASVTLTALVHGTVVTQRDHARQAVEDACAQLAQAVAVLGKASPLGGGIVDLGNRSQLRKQPG